MGRTIDIWRLFAERLAKVGPAAQAAADTPTVESVDGTPARGAEEALG